MAKLAANGGTATTTYTYDTAFSQCASITDPLGRQIVSGINPANGDVNSVTDARGYRTGFDRNAFGDATTITNALSQQTIRTYGNFGELLTSTDPLGHQTTWTYDAASRVVSIQDANGKVVHFTYDLLDHVLTRWQVVNGQTLTTSFTYDPDGNRRGT